MRIYYTRVTIAIDSNYRQVFASEEIRIYLHQIDSSIKSDVCDRYLTRAKRTAEDQYASLRSAISETIQCQGWKVEQITFITGARSVNKQDLSKNLKFFNVPEACIHSIYSKVAMRVFDATPIVVPPLIRTIDTCRPDKYKRWRKESHEAKDK